MVSASVLLLTFLFALGTCSPSANSGSASNPVSTDGRCGPSYGNQTCTDSAGGGCCSIWGYCGDNFDFCRADRCQQDYGTCLPAGTTPSSYLLTRTINQATSCSVSGTTTLTSTLTLLSTSTLPQETVTLAVQAITVTALSTLTLPGADRPTTVFSPTTLTLAPDPVTITATSIPPAVVSMVTQFLTVSIPPAITQIERETISFTATLVSTLIPYAVVNVVTQSLTGKQLKWERSAWDWLTYQLRLPRYPYLQPSRKYAIRLSPSSQPSHPCLFLPRF
ncbi:hypothetical protein EK21DRAFT_87406 [Setomelanomma holmii]|uniref:Chitin-binding type-1 domain-containing protein n=1 Tax=Setomelanomma holmii TaxID=210430 RepID=A0A9P4HEV6_9PLEO|nr:hypothetical protein EK21DRAFT_87406 [Setomelanomma holmii]